MIISENRVDWRYVVPLYPESRLLYLNSKDGVVPSLLARLCLSLFVLDNDIEQLCLIKSNAERKGERNIHPIALQIPLCLPLKEGNVDIVVIEEFEDAAVLYKSSEDEILTLVGKLLKPGGMVCLIVSNPFDYRRIFSGRFPLFGRERKKLKAFLPWKCRQLLERKGLQVIDSYAMIPDHRNLKFMFPLESRFPLNYYIESIFERKSLKGHMLYYGTKLLLLLGLFSSFVPSYLIIARKGAT